MLADLHFDGLAVDPFFGDDQVPQVVGICVFVDSFVSGGGKVVTLDGERSRFVSYFGGLRALLFLLI